jgi:hypothetical protein
MQISFAWTQPHEEPAAIHDLRLTIHVNAIFEHRLDHDESTLYGATISPAGKSANSRQSHQCNNNVHRPYDLELPG